jgi:hypothetical protein
MNLVPTELNRRLAELVENRVIAENLAIAGKAGFWRFIGLGILGLGLGTAVGIGFAGYAHIARNSDRLETFTSAFITALKGAQLKASAEGTINLETNEISLAKDQTISLDRDARLRLDPAAKVFADGELRVHAPSITLPPASTSRANTRNPTITNFTVFKSLPYEDGKVMTGWMFLTSIQKSPTHQYCYYTTESSEVGGPGLRVDIGSDQKMETPKTLPKNFDISAPFGRCVWFRTANL